LPPDERNLRLAVTELRWFLIPLLNLTAANRNLLINQIPEAFRPLLEERLKQWDKLPPDTQQEFLKNEAALHHILRLSNTSPPKQRAILATLPEAQRARIEAAWDNWRALPATQRDTITTHFNQFFALSEKEKVRTLSVLAPQERQQMERTLASFERLPKEEREYCIGSFSKFAGMSAAERDQFLRNAARWVEMTPAERQGWRELVRRLRSPEVLPPMPPGLLPVSAVANVTTNFSR
jgi:hypothetical protein